MNFNKKQERYLRVVWAYRAGKPTLWRSIRADWSYWTILCAMGVLGRAISFLPGYGEPGWMMVGLACGALARTIGGYIVVVQMWPVNREIIDWRRVSELLGLTSQAAVRQGSAVPGSASIIEGQLRVEPGVLCRCGSPMVREMASKYGLVARIAGGIVMVLFAIGSVFGFILSATPVPGIAETHDVAILVGAAQAAIALLVYFIVFQEVPKLVCVACGRAKNYTGLANFEDARNSEKG